MSSDEELATFVAARLDEDEAAAKAIEDRSDPWPGQWVADGNHALRTYNGWVLAASVPTGSEFAPGVLAHIARHDPARVLREVEAKRKRLALYLDAKETLAVALKKAPPEDDPATAHSYVRERINVNQASGRFTALEMSVRLDAMVYGDHPDYRAEWKPA